MVAERVGAAGGPRKVGSFPGCGPGSPVRRLWGEWMNPTAAQSRLETQKQAIIRIDGVSLSFGGVNALSDVSLNVRNDEILAIIGPNGAGKTALLNCISGFYKPQKGEIYFEDTRRLPVSGRTSWPRWASPAPFRTSSSTPASAPRTTSWPPGTSS